MTSTAGKNYHACVLRIGEHGILIEGQSGTGKTSLALHLLERCHLTGISAALISDDQCLLENRTGNLIASAPLPIAGKMELPHFGIISLPHEAETRISHVFSLRENAERMPMPDKLILYDIELPRITLPVRNANASSRIILYTLKLWPSWKKNG